MTKQTLTIGELAKQGNVATSLLRYYEKEGLLEPVGRTAAGYRFYSPESVRHLRFIRRAQRYGFSLNDIKLMRGAAHDSDGSKHDIRKIAEQRFLEIERRVTEMLVLRHELEIFLDDVTEQIGETAGPEVGNQYRELIEQICGHEHDDQQRSSLQKLTERLGCNLASAEWESLLTDLRGEHLHIWQDDDESYSILFTNQTAMVVKALQKLAACESGCEAHLEPTIEKADGGTLFRARGKNAFLFAQLFLALEVGEA
ncbi:MAG: MerR family transcriptional regulator [Gammaproteobacteria bacterium]|nr:MerR family transcriptional regulator [Gammaproteobacteria bacterium]MCP4089845.1 MerR family transcriptional regulator [Gammaproteobacteria bacterium]MCP4275500.1 MerR family transcriptional regulator [Gammaproteobacteria bacterium]MCP4832992.1 MerR family transcriptional regulator [Gammaproteobacteria bacterium]MCP4928636.1 MerR family transcriptional regulator [Gammaproteobacteria bacterium]